MFTSSVTFLILSAYLLLLFLIAEWVERKPFNGRLVNNALVYSLSLAIYCTSWTFYGSVGKAVQSQLLFLTIYLGPTLAIALWWIVLRRIVRIKNRYAVTSIADFISTRYDKSQAVAALCSLIVFVGIIPYIALQLKSFFSTLSIITTTPFHTAFELIIIGMIITFTIVFGFRRLDAAEQHLGMVFVIALESLVKLTAFLSVGFFVVYSLFGGGGTFLERLPALSVEYLQDSRPSLSTWITYLVLSMSAILFLPRQFHMSVVENLNERHIKHSMWLLPLYFLLINLFVVPIALGGLAAGFSPENADTFVLTLPFHHGYKWLALFVFIGGFSAGISMIMVSSLTMATMASNHVILPVVAMFKKMSWLKRYLLQVRWIAVACFILTGYIFTKTIGESYTLVNMGMISFAAVFQFVPAIIGGLFWRKGNRAGAFLGLSAGFLVWFYTLLLPAFVKSGWIPPDILTDGPWGIFILRPENLFGAAFLDPLSHGAFWSFLFNLFFYILGSLFFKQSPAEQRIATEFTNVLLPQKIFMRTGGTAASASLIQKKQELKTILFHYLDPKKAEEIISFALEKLNLENEDLISIYSLSEFYNEVENQLARLTGRATAHKIIHEEIRLSPQETLSLSNIYTKILAEMNMSPEELMQKVDFYQERHSLLNEQAKALESNIKKLNQEITMRKEAEQKLQEAYERTEETNEELNATNEELMSALDEVDIKTQKLEESEAMLQLVLDTIPVRVFWKDRNSVFLGCNRAVAKDAGFSRPEEMIGKTDFDMPWKEEAGAYLKDDQLVMEDNSPKYHIIEPQLQADGTKAWLETNKIPLRDKENRVVGILGTYEDITKRREAEQKLKELHEKTEQTNKELNKTLSQLNEKSKELEELNAQLEERVLAQTIDSRRNQQLLRSIIDNAPALIFLKDTAGRYILVNQVFEEIFDVKESGIKDKTDKEIFPPELADKFQKDDHAVISSKVILTFEESVLTQDGPQTYMTIKFPLMDSNGQVYAICGISNNISERKDYEQRLLQIKAALNNASDAILITNKKGEVVYLNQAFETLFGKKLEDINREGLTSLYAHKETAFSALDTLAHGKPWEGEAKMLNGIGQRLDSLHRVTPVLDDHSNIVGALLVYSDITEKKSIENQLRHAQKMESIGQLAAGIAHEINTPTQYVMNNTKFLQEAFQDLVGILEEYHDLLTAAKKERPSPEIISKLESAIEEADLEYLLDEVPQAIQQSLDGTTRISEIVMAMKNFAHPGEKDMVATNLNSAIENTVLVARNEWKYVSNVETHLDPELPTIPCLVGEFNQMILNLIVNAAHAIAESLQEQPDQKGTITIMTKAVKDEVEVSVSDTGAGIPEEIRPLIFDPFFTTKELGKGTGQGLAIVHSVVKKHNGIITFESEIGKGTTFIIRLPITSENREERND